MQRSKRMAAIITLASALVLVAGPRSARAYSGDYDGRGGQYQERQPRGYNDQYIFATTRMVSEWDVEPAIKVPLFPPAVIIDLVFLPAEMIAGFF
jgi:hypothetical protein